MSTRGSPARGSVSGRGRQDAPPAYDVATRNTPPIRPPSPDLPILHELVRCKDIQGVLRHLDRSLYSDINSFDHKGRTALHLACLTDSLDLVRLLLRRGAFVNALTDKNQLSPLHCACIKNQLEVSRLLLKYGADPLMPNSDGITPLGLLPKNKDNQRFIKAVLKPSAPEKPPKRDRELLAKVHANEELKVLDLLDKGADVNAMEETTYLTPLMIAAKNGNEDIVRLLLYHCADVHRQDRAKNSALHWAAAKGNKAICEMILEFDASVNLTDRENGFTPLHWAVVKNNVDLVPLFVGRYKANPNLPDNEGLTPLHLAARKGTLQMIEALLGLPFIQVDAPDAYGVRPLHMAIRKNDVKVTQALLQVGKANPTVGTLIQTTPLHDACEEPNPNIIAMLIATNRVNVNAKDHEGKTPLHVAVSNLDKKGRSRRLIAAVVETIRYLGSKGADPNIRDFAGRTPLMIIDPGRALVDGTIENLTARTLVSIQADINILHRSIYNQNITQQQKDQITSLVELLQRRQGQDDPALFVRSQQAESGSSRAPQIGSTERAASQTVLAAAAVGRAAAAAAAANIPDDDDDESHVAGHLTLNEVSCPLCLELLFKPCSLDCGHNFCQPCLDEAVNFHTACPVCRSPMKGRGVKYPVNAMFATMIERSFPERYQARRQDYANFAARQQQQQQQQRRR